MERISQLLFRHGRYIIFTVVTQEYGYGGEGGWKVSAMTAVMKDLARMMEIEFVHITRDTTAESLEEQLFLNDLTWKLRQYSRFLNTAL